MLPHMKIGTLSTKSGVPASAIRYYERVGLLQEPRRSESGYRDYSESAINRLRFIRDGQSSGLSLDDVSHLIALLDKGMSTCGHSLALLGKRVKDIEKQMASLERMHSQLTAVTGRSADFRPEDCTDPTSCQVITAKSSEASSE